MESTSPAHTDAPSLSLSVTTTGVLSYLSHFFHDHGLWDIFAGMALAEKFGVVVERSYLSQGEVRIWNAMAQVFTWAGVGSVSMPPEWMGLSSLLKTI